MLAVGLSVAALGYMYQSASAADTTVTIAADALTTESIVVNKKGKKIFSVSGGDGKLYRSRQRGAAGVYEFLTKNINIVDGQQMSLSDLPSSLEPDRIVNDQEDPLLQKAGKAANRKHYYFKQKMKNLEVFGSQVAVHQKDDADVYAFDGVLLDESTLQRERLTTSQAQLIARNHVQQEGGGRAGVNGADKAAVNPKLLGISADEKTYPSLIVYTDQTIDGLANPKRTIVSLTDGSVLSSLELMNEAMDRKVYDCKENPTGSCSLKRVEGGAAVGIKDVDGMYGFLGEIYTFYSTKMQRDSYNNQGATMKAFVNLPAELNGEKLCPNARWTQAVGGAENQIQTCPGWATEDIVAHELTHGVVEYTAALDFLNQAGALNEAIADIFAMGIDVEDWQIGEDLSIGSLRYLDDPSKNRTLGSQGATAPNPMPDRMYSTRYYCGTADRGGVHINMSVPTKAFYLMAEGGNFNNCTMSPVGKDKSLLIWYQALTKYLSATSNFRDAYNAVVQGCTDLYGATSNECIQTKKSLQAVEMDQQPVGDQLGPKCSNITPQPAACVGATEPTAAPTPAITNIACTNVQGDANGDSRVSLTDFETWRKAFMRQN